MLKSFIGPLGLCLSFIMVALIEPALGGDLCFAVEDNSECNLGENSLCCTDAPEGECCTMRDPAWCYYGGASNLPMKNTVSFFPISDCAAGLATNYCDPDHRIDALTCCNSFVPHEDGVDSTPLTCALMWTKLPFQAPPAGARRDGNCSEPDMLTYTDGTGKTRKAKIPQGKAKDVSKLLRDGDWRALSEFKDHEQSRQVRQIARQTTPTICTAVPTRVPGTLTNYAITILSPTFDDDPNACSNFLAMIEGNDFAPSVFDYSCNSNAASHTDLTFRTTSTDVMELNEALEAVWPNSDLQCLSDA